MERRLFLWGMLVALIGLSCVTHNLAAQSEESHPVKVVGKVRAYEPGKRIGIDIRPQVEKTYDLASKDCTYLVDPDIQVGSNVEAEEKKDENGKKMVVIRLKR